MMLSRGFAWEQIVISWVTSVVQHDASRCAPFSSSSYALLLSNQRQKAMRHCQRGSHSVNTWHFGLCGGIQHVFMRQYLLSYSLICALSFQVLPFASEETLQQLESNLSSVPSVTELLHQGLAPREITDRLLEGIGYSEGPASSLHPR